MAMLYNGCDCKARPYPSVVRERSIWQCDDCLTIYQIYEGFWEVLRGSPVAARALAESKLY